VKAEIVNYDQASYFNFLMSENEYDIAINTPVAPSNLPADIFGNYPHFIPQDWSGPDQDEYYAVGAKANSTSDLETRMDLVYELLQLHTKHVLWYGLCEDPLVYAYNKDLKNIKYTVSGLTLYQTITF
jgi:ABC-type transport system substrate-binding protein